GALVVAGTVAILNLNVTSDRPPRFLQPLQQPCDGVRCQRIVRGDIDQHSDTSHPFAWLRPRRQRPRRRRGAEGEEGAAVHGVACHSITSSAATCSVSGTVRPSALAVFMLITSSNFTGCCTGRSAGFSPRRMRST